MLAFYCFFKHIFISGLMLLLYQWKLAIIVHFYIFTLSYLYCFHILFTPRFSIFSFEVICLKEFHLQHRKNMLEKGIQRDISGGPGYWVSQASCMDQHKVIPGIAVQQQAPNNPDMWSILRHALLAPVLMAEVSIACIGKVDELSKRQNAKSLSLEVSDYLAVRLTWTTSVAILVYSAVHLPDFSPPLFFITLDSATCSCKLFPPSATLPSPNGV